MGRFDFIAIMGLTIFTEMAPRDIMVALGT